MPIQGLQFTIPSGQEGHQSYQATGSFIVYNPNDGVAYVATDRTATSLLWDYKVPSQSGGRFPGPINSYLSIYYTDQSGTNATGQVVVYASPEPVNIPHFWSIGRALLTQTNSMDIVQGAQPANPGAGISRLWSNTSGSLHILLPNGTDKVVLDSSNYASYVNTLPLGGDLFGTINAGHVGIRNNSTMNVYDTGGTSRRMFLSGTDNINYFFVGTSGQLIIYSDVLNGGPLASFDANANIISLNRPTQIPQGLTVVNNPMTGIWNSGTVTVTQGVSCIYSVSWARWVQLGRTIHLDCYITFTGTAGTAGQVIVVALGGGIPLNSNYGASYSTKGSFLYLRSGITFYVGSVTISGSSVVFMTNGQQNFLGATPSFQVTNGDALTISATYEV